jgi:hypothetical protein
VPRAPRLTGCEHHFFFDISWRPTAAQEGPCFVCLLVSFSFVFAFSVSPLLLFLFGTYAHSSNSALPRLLAPTTYHRSGYAHFRRFGIPCTSRDLSLLIFCCCSAPALRAGQHEISLSRVFVVEALRVTLARHMTHGMFGLGRSDSDKGHPFPWPYLFIQLANSRSNGSET